MSDYSVQVSWSGKDGLSDSDPNKIVSGSDFNTEFAAIATANGSKMDKSSNLSDVTSASTARTNLGVVIGTDVVGPSTAQEYTAAQNFNSTALTDAATVAWDTSANQVCTVTLGDNRIIGLPTNLKDGAFYHLTVIQDGTGSRTLTWNGIFKWPSTTAPTLTTTASAQDEFTFRSNGTNLYNTGQSLSVGTA